MVFEQKKFSKLTYKKSSYGNGRIGELVIKENGNKVDFFTFRSNKEFKLVTDKLKKYGWGEEDKREIDEEIKLLNAHYQNGN